MGLRRRAMLAISLVAILTGCGATSTSTNAASSAIPSTQTAEMFTLNLEAGAMGWDISYPQCSTALPEPRDFAIIGVNAVLPTQPNECFDTQVSWAGQFTEPLMLYVNAANPAGLGTPTWPKTGSNRFGQCTGEATEACSYQYGQDRIAYDLKIIGNHLKPGTVIFIVVEREFSWEDGKQTPASNTATLEGMADAIRTAGAQPGIYANGSDWHILMGSVEPGDNLHGLPIWWRGAVTLADAKANCHQRSFTGGKVVIAQIAALPGSGKLDENVAC